jgi:hypothetical protein
VGEDGENPKFHTHQGSSQKKRKKKKKKKMISALPCYKKREKNIS